MPTSSYNPLNDEAVAHALHRLDLPPLDATIKETPMVIISTPKAQGGIYDQLESRCLNLDREGSDG